MKTALGVRAVDPSLAATVAELCHWRSNVADVRETSSHVSFHYGSPCPYEVAAAVLVGERDPREDVAEWRLDVSSVLDAKGAVPLTLNSRHHWAKHASEVAKIKARARRAVMDVDVPHLDHVHVELHYRPRTSRFRDVDNIVATLKPIIDALHHAAPELPDWQPIIDGDDPRYLSWSPPLLHPWRRGEPAALWVILRAFDAH